MNISDKNITTLLESRNEQALKLLSEKYGGLCSSISYNVLGNRSDSEEVTNDTYMKVWNTIPPEKPRSLCAYVAKIVRNLSLDKLRYNNRSKRCGETDALLSELEECIPATDNTEKSAENNELKSVLNAFLAQLFVLRYFACYSIADISERLAITETNTTSILSRTRNKLRKYLSDKKVYIQKGENHE
jgi:RNA polymerase sigma factor (sigma-70 family)